jgi:hypothetical protein
MPNTNIHCYGDSIETITAKKPAFLSKRICTEFEAKVEVQYTKNIFELVTV